MRKLATTAAAVTMRSCASTSHIRGVIAEIRIIVPQPPSRLTQPFHTGLWPFPLPRTNASGSTTVRLQGLIDRGQYLLGGKLIETLAAAVEMALAAELFTRQTRQRVLHHPNIAAVLDRTGMRPGFLQASHRPRPDQAWAGRPVERHRRAADAGCKMGHGGIRSHIDGRALEQGCEARPVEPAAFADDRRLRRRPKAVHVGAFGRVAPLGDHHGQAAFPKTAGQPPPASSPPRTCRWPGSCSRCCSGACSGSTPTTTSSAAKWVEPSRMSWPSPP